MKSKVDIISFLAGLGIVVFGLIRLYPDHPRVTVILGSGFFLLVALAWLSEYRRNKAMAASEGILAELHCPRCGSLYGAAAAFAAFHPPPPPEPMIGDNFGYLYVICPSCGERSLFHDQTHELA